MSMSADQERTRMNAHQERMRMDAQSWSGKLFHSMFQSAPCRLLLGVRATSANPLLAAHTGAC